MDLQGQSNGQGTNPFYLHKSLRPGWEMRAVRRKPGISGFARSAGGL